MRERFQSGGDAVLSDPPPPVDCDDARRLVLELYRLEAREIRELPGERDRNFRLIGVDGAEYVLKVVHPAEDPAVTDFQARMLVHVESRAPELDLPRVVGPVHGIDEPIAVADIAGTPCRVRCVTYIPGRPLADTRSSTRQLRSLGHFAARLDLALADFRHPADDHELLWDLKRAERARRYLSDVADPVHRARVARVFDRYVAEVEPRLESLRAQVIHNDFNPHNVLTSPTDPDDVIAVIDFGDAIRAPLVQELAVAGAYQLPADGHPLEPVAQMCQAFHLVNPLRPEEIAIVPELVVIRLALSITIASWRAAKHRDNVTYILRSLERVRANLERLEHLRPAERGRWLIDRMEHM